MAGALPRRQAGKLRPVDADVTAIAAAPAIVTRVVDATQRENRNRTAGAVLQPAEVDAAIEYLAIARFVVGDVAGLAEIELVS